MTSMAESAKVQRDASVVIPVLNAARYLPALLEAFRTQKPAPPREVILVDSHSTDDTRDMAATRAGVRIVPIGQFSHGRARNLGAREAGGDIVVLMTQDALPRDDHWLAKLLEPFADGQVAAVFSRQLPRADAHPMERFFLETHFPPGPPVRRQKKPGAPLTFPDVFFSNVSAAVRRDVLLRHPFDETLIMSEDQQFARDILNAGYATLYQPESVVYHSHAYTLREVFKRYFDSVHSLTVIFPKHGLGSSASIGVPYLMREMRHMVVRHPRRIPYYFLYTVAKTAGTVMGHFAPVLPRFLLRRLSLHSYHWKGP